MESKGQRGQIVKLSGERCGRGSTGHAFEITVGKATKECSYRTPVLGRDLEIAATMRLLSGTPIAVQRIGLPLGRPARRRRRPLPARRLPAAAQGAAAQDPRRRLDRVPRHREERGAVSAGRTRRTSCACAPSTSPPATNRGNCRPPRLPRRQAGRRSDRRRFRGARRPGFRFLGRLGQGRQGSAGERRRCRRARSPARSRPSSTQSAAR